MAEGKSSKPDFDPAMPCVQCSDGDGDKKPHPAYAAGIDRWTLGAFLIAPALASRGMHMEDAADQALMLSARILEKREQFSGWMDFLESSVR